MKTNIYKLLAVVLSLAALAFVGVSSRSADSGGGGQTTGCGC